MLSLGAAAGAQQMPAHMNMDTPAKAPPSSVKRSLWSDPKSWPSGKAPRAGDAVTIFGRDKSIVLDINPPALRSLTIEGKLSFSNDKDIELKTDWIYFAGRRAGHRQ